MILSVSRRTDIPAFYADWFFERLRAGHVLVRNPMNARQVARVSLSPEDVEGIVFWTKNPGPLLSRLDLLRDYRFYVQMTLTAYGPEIEPEFQNTLPAFQRLADAIGLDRVIWRYDPILLNPRYTAAWHAEAFADLARQLDGYTRACTISFIDAYRNTKRHADVLNLIPIDELAMHAIARVLADIAAAHGIATSACCEPIDLTADGVTPARCIDSALLGLPFRKDPHQRPGCGCAASVDIGAYNTCPGGCRYCYANYDEPRVRKNQAAHDMHAPLLIGQLGPEDRIYDRK